MEQFKHCLFSSFSYGNLFILSLLLFPILLYALLIMLKPSTERPNLPPSPPKLPFIGNLHLIGTLPHRSLRALSLKYGPLMLLKFGSFPILIVSSSQVVEEIIKKHDEAFSNRPILVASNLFSYGGRDVIFRPYGDSWRQARTVCVLQLLSQKMVREFRSIREEVVGEMLKRVGSSCLDGSAVNLGDLFYSLAISMICRSAAGEGYKVYGETYKDLVRKAQNIVASLCFTDLFPYLGWIDNLSGYNTRLKSLFKELDNFLDEMIDEHANRINDDTSTCKDDFGDILLRLQRDGKLNAGLERDDIKGIIQSMLGAATDTVASLMQWMMAELLKHPSIMQKAQDEVRRAVGSKTKIDESDIDQMQYLRCVVKESMRLHGFGLLPRETNRKVEVCGYEIPAKTRVMINNWAVQRDERVWAKAEEFIPERFMDVEIEFKGQSTKFIPFGFGRRMCPGVAYALTLVEIVMANLLQWFDWELPEGAAPQSLDMSEKYAQAIYLKHPLRAVPKHKQLNPMS